MQRPRFEEPGPLTTLTGDRASMVASLDPDPLALCRAAQGLLVSPDVAAGVGIAAGRMAERHIRPADEIIRCALELGTDSPEEARPLDRRVVGTCRHFAVVAVALLRAHRHAARARCGFATYFEPGRNVDHWIVELRDPSGRWRRIDTEMLDLGVVDRPDDLRPGRFLTGGEAWEECRSARTDPMTYGVHGTGNWGPAEVIGNVIRDLASLHRVEMLPWDEWGPMTRCYSGDIDRATEVLVDEVAAATRRESDDLGAMYDQLRVPDEMLR